MDKISRQLSWQRRQREAGKCPKCGEDTGGKYYCEHHRELDRINAKLKYQRRKARKQETK